MATRFTQRRTKWAALLFCAPVFDLLLLGGALANSPALLVEPAKWSDTRVALKIVPADSSTEPTQSTTPPPRNATAEGISTAPSSPADGAAAPPTGTLRVTGPPAVVVPGVPPVAPVVVEPSPIIPPTNVVPPTAVDQPAEIIPPSARPTPMLGDEARHEELLPLDEQQPADVRVGVRPYGGGHPGDWSWGCGGSPYRTGPGRCDNWKVGCSWAVTVDGIVLSREEANLLAIAAEIEGDDAGATPLEDPVFEQFDHGPGGRITFMSQVPHYVGYQIQVAYEGVEEWNSSIVYEKQPLDVNPPLPPVPPNPDPFPEGTEQHSLHYRSSLHSGELNFVRSCSPVWRPYCGVRYIKFDDEINDFINQDAQPPLAGPRDAVDVDPTPDVSLVFPPIGPVTTTDRLNLLDIENNLIGFQIGLLHDTWRLNRRFAVEGFANTGLYYNKIKYTNLMGIFTTQEFADNTNTAAINEARTDFSDTINNDVRELSEIAYVCEGSLSGVWRLNKCWALRAGYQALWIANVHLAEDAFLIEETDGRSLFFHGWHAGIECRR